jgi:lipopolysaccharide export system protein LptA
MTMAVSLAPFLARGGAQTPSPPASKPGGAVQTYHYADSTNGKIVDAVFTGTDSTSLSNGAIQVKQFRMIGVRNGQLTNVAVTAEAPECRIEYASSRQAVGDPGPIQIYTPTTNLFAQGVGFFCAESNQVFYLSNQVETRVLKSMLRSPLFQAASNAAPDAGQMVKIFSGRGQYVFRSNVMDYAEEVRVIDPQYELDAPLLSIQFASNQSVETMFARTGVTLTLPGKGTATGATAHYFATNENTILELDGDAETPAQWHNGEQEARAAKFTYDPDRHLLNGRDRARIRWPNRPADASAPHTFMEMFADDASLQMTSDGRGIEHVTAGGNVILVNQSDQSSATAGKADYDRPRDLFTLTENPVWWNDRVEIRGDTLTQEPSNSVYHAWGHARLKLLASGAAGASASPTNQWLIVTADGIDSRPLNSQTNLITFRGDVQARLLEGGQLQDSLTCDVLLAYQLCTNKQGLGNPVVLLVARENVRGETARNAAGVMKRISCGVLTARRSAATGLWQSIVGEENAVVETFGSDRAAVSNHLTAPTITALFSPVTNQIESAVAEGGVLFAQTGPAKDGAVGAVVSNHLTAATVNAHFSAVTNHVESAVAEGKVVFAQIAPGKTLHAIGSKAVYSALPEEQVELTGHPWAQTDKLTIVDADRLTYELQSNAVDTSGKYHIILTKTNAVGAPSPGHPSP